MRVVVCAKEVLDPDAVNAFAVNGRLALSDDGREIVQAGVPRLMNGYDEQGIEAALRLRDSGHPVALTVLTVGPARPELARKAFALGADEVVQIDTGMTTHDPICTGRIIAAYVKTIGGVELTICGRQASDDDQGVVPGVVGEFLAVPVVQLVRELSVQDGMLRLVRVTPAGDEGVECALPAVISITSELGAVRAPNARNMLAARRKAVTHLRLEDLGLAAAEIAPRLRLRRLEVPQKQVTCHFLPPGDPAEAAAELLRELREHGLFLSGPAARNAGA